MNEKAVLISIKPKYCELIAKGRKTIELRKTKPTLKPPFKCYIYCTKDKKQTYWYGKIYRYVDDHSHNAFDKPLNGKIIGEFICDSILGHCEMANADIAEQYGCVKRENIFEYSNGKEVFGWHISNLIIYDKPKELELFCKTTISSLEEIQEESLVDLCDCCCYTNYGKTEMPLNCDKKNCRQAYEIFYKENFKITRPPQSWCYVNIN